MTFCGKESASLNWLTLSDLLLVSWLLSVYTDVTNPTYLNNGKAIPGNKLVQCGTSVHCVSDVLVFGPFGYVSVRFKQGIAREKPTVAAVFWRGTISEGWSRAKLLTQ